jgi:subtilisin family serine protease
MKQVSRRSSTKFFLVGAVLGATLLLCLTAMVAAAPAAFSAPERASYIVVLKDDVAHPANAAHRHEENRGARISHIYGVALKGYSADLTPGAVRAIKKDPNVDYVESDGVIRPKGQVVGNQLKRVYAAQNPVLDIDGVDDAKVNVDIAILDTGVADHPDLNIVSRVNCVEYSGAGPCKAGQASDDLSGHGTHVAGDAAAIDNGIGMVGTAPGARIWSVKVVNKMSLATGTDEVGMSAEYKNDLKDGNAMMSDAIAGINWVTINSSQIEVANMSFTCVTADGGCARIALKEAIATSVNNGVVWVAAAGQGGLALTNNDPFLNYRFYPAMLADVITVSAMADYDGLSGSLSNSNGCPLEKGSQHDDRLMGQSPETSPGYGDGGRGSNYGPEVDMTAPGSCVFSTWSPYVTGYNRFKNPVASEYGVMYGSSVASALVAGAAADIAAQYNPNNRADVEKIRAALLGAGNYDWEDLRFDFFYGPVPADGYQEPLLSLDGIPSVPSPPPPSPPAPPPAPPTVTIGSASNVSVSSAVISGTVNPNGYDGRYKFECGVTGSGYTIDSAPEGIYFATGTSPINVSWGVNGLQMGTNYSCRLVAWNIGNIASPVHTPPVIFTTPRVMPYYYFRAAADGKLHELSYKKISSWHESGDLTAPIASGTSPSSFRNTSGLKRTFFVSSVDNKVHELSETGGGWAEGPALSQKVAAGISPSAIASSGGGARFFFIADADKKIHEVSFNGSWSESAALAPQKAGTTSSPVAVPYNGSTRILFVGENGYVQFLHQEFPGAAWGVSGPAISRTKVVPGTAISAFVNTTGLPRAYFVSTGDTEADKNTIHEVGYNPSTFWSETAALTPPVATGSSPSALPWANGGVKLYFAGTDRKIREVSYNGTWSVSGPLSSPLATGASPSALAWTGGQIKVYYPGEDSKVHELSYSGSSWYDSVGQTQKMTTGAALAPIGGGSNGLSVHYVGADGKLRDLTYTISPAVSWSEEVGATTMKMAAGTSPTSFVNTTNQPRAYFVGEDGKVHELAYNPANGTYAQSGALSQKVAPGTSPTAIAAPNGGVRFFFIAEADKKLHEVSYNGSWSESAALAPQKVGTTSSPVAVPYNGSTRILFVGENGYVQYLLQDFPGAAWGVSAPGVSRTKVVPGTAISAFVNTTGLPRAYFVSTGDTEADKNTIHEVGYNPSTFWSETAALTPPVATGSSPSALPWANGGVKLYFAGATDKKIRELSYNGTWSVSGPLSSPLATGASPSALTWSGEMKILFPSANNRLHEISYNGAWSESYDLSGSVETGTSLSSFSLIG